MGHTEQLTKTQLYHTVIVLFTQALLHAHIPWNVDFHGFNVRERFQGYKNVKSIPCQITYSVAKYPVYVLVMAANSQGGIHNLYSPTEFLHCTF